MAAVGADSAMRKGTHCASFTIHNDDTKEAFMERKIHVLIADDEGGFRETLTKILQHKDVVVSQAVNAEQTLDSLQYVVPDVILLDMRMPGLSGEDILPRIRAMQPGVAVILLTGHGEEISARKARADGAFDYLCKPCGVDILVARIHDAVRIGRNGLAVEKSVGEIMIPIEQYTTVQASSTIREGIERLKIASESFISSGLVMDSGHRAILVFDGEELAGVLTMRNLIQAIRPSYLDEDSYDVNHAVRFSHWFWDGLFSLQVERLAGMRVGDIMNPRPPVVDVSANLTHVAHLLCAENRRRVAVEHAGRIVGVVREQELFHEVSRLMLSRS